MIKYIKTENKLSFIDINNHYNIFSLQDNLVLFISGFIGFGKTFILKSLIENYTDDYNKDVIYSDLSNKISLEIKSLNNKNFRYIFSNFNKIFLE